MSIIIIIISVSFDTLWYHMADKLITIKRVLIVTDISKQKSDNLIRVKIELKR